MKEHTFRSPGFFEREIDLSARETNIEGVPGGVVGTAERGPAFVPVTIGSFSDFEFKFGTLDPDRFGPYAADAFLKYKTALTYVRVLGAGANNSVSDIQTTEAAGTVKNAGFVIKSSLAGAPDTLGRHNGSVQFIAATHEVKAAEEGAGDLRFTDNNSFGISGATARVNLVRAAIFTTTASRVEILSHDAYYTSTATTNDVAAIRSYDGTDIEGMFKLVISSSEGSSFSSDEGKPGIKILTASLDPTSEFYIGKVLNTSPDRFEHAQHLLYLDLPVESEIAKVYHDTSNPTYYSVIIASGSDGTSSDSGLSTTSFRDLFGNFKTRYQTARTTSFISQPFGGTEHDLFHFESLDDGEVGNTRVKISISNLKRSTDVKDPYGTFAVLVRSFNDTDTNMSIVERYSQCNLNPASADYVANKIGDLKAYYDFDASTDSEKRINVTGKRPNRSAYIRIVMSPQVEDGYIPKATLPFGFRGLPVLKLNDNLTDGTATLPMGSNRSRLNFVTAGTANDAGIGYSIVPPVPFTFKVTGGKVNASPSFTGQPGSLELAASRYFWGIKTQRIGLTGSNGDAALSPNGYGGQNKLIESYSKLLGIQKLDTLVTGSGADEFNNNKFTLARVCLNNQSSATATLESALSTEITGSAAEHMREAAYIRNAELVSPNNTVVDVGYTRRLTFASLAASTEYKYFNRFTDYLKFTNILYGGFDGLNILDRDMRLMNDKASSNDTLAGGKAGGGQISYGSLDSSYTPGTGIDNNIISSYRAGARIITDPLASRVNVVTVPGIRSSYVTNYFAKLTKEYSKALFIMDINAYDDDLNTLFDDATTRPNVRKTIEQFESRAIDNSYVAVYFPDIIKNDRINGDAVNMPASVAAMGALAYNDKVSFPWFAPAGFNRGALTEVINTEVRLNTEDRNTLYEARINPIASFPTGPFVIFGQKTLQKSSSALDRVNVRRMLLEVKRIVSEAANRIVFEQNTPSTRARFVASVTPSLSTIQVQQGIDQFKVVMDASNNTQNDIENNRLNGRIVLVPTRAIEFIAMDFIITNSGVSFE
jgi:hypothetical protein